MPRSDARPGSDLFHRTVGSGLPVVALHGGPGFDHGYLRPALGPLTDVLSVTYADLRGNGRSPRPTSDEEWSALTLDHLVDDVERLRATIGAERILLLGHCFGGAVAQEYALRWPDRVLGLVLVSSYPAFDHAGTAFQRAVARATEEERESLERAFAGPVPDDEGFERLWRALRGVYFHDPRCDAAERAFAGQRSSAGAFNWGMQRALPAFSTVGRLHALRVPTLVVAGDDDWLGPIEATAARLASLLPDAELVVLERSGHFPFLERPRAWERHLRDWLDRRLAHAGTAHGPSRGAANGPPARAPGVEPCER